MESPFEALHEFHTSHPNVRKQPSDSLRALAVACAVAHHSGDEIWSACRAIQKLTRLSVNPADFLGGRFFAAYVDPLDGEISNFEALREHAQAFLEKHGG